MGLQRNEADSHAESDPHDKIALTAISRKQLEFRKNKAGELNQTTIRSYFDKYRGNRDQTSLFLQSRKLRIKNGIYQ